MTIKESISERASDYAEKCFPSDDIHNFGKHDVAFHSYSAGAGDQMKIDANEMAKLNEEWKQNLAIQRAMLIDKAVAFLVHNRFFEHKASRCAKAFRKAMED